MGYGESGRPWQSWLRLSGSFAIAACVAVFCLAGAAPAAAAVGDFSFKQCISLNGNGGLCLNGGLIQESTYDGETSPDGRHVYQASWGSTNGGLRILDRDPATGLLTPRSAAADCYTDSGTGGACTDVNAMSKPLDALISPDGKHLYVAAWGSSAIAVFDRDAATGRLTQKAGAAGCVSNSGANGCRVGRALSTVLNLALSPDGKNLYATAQTGGGAIAILQVLPDGSLEQSNSIDGCVTETGDDGLGNSCADGTAISTGFGLAISPDGRHVYGASPSAQAVILFNRDEETGELTQKSGLDGCISQNGFPDGSMVPRCRTQAQLSVPRTALISKDGNTVYALGAGNSIVAFSRATNGLLTFQSCVNEPGDQGCADGRGVSGLENGAISPDGTALVAHNVGGATGGLSFFDIAANGDLVQRAGVQGCATANGSTPSGASQCQVLPVAGGEGNVEFASNEFLHYGAFSNSALIVLDRDFGPTCQNVTASTGPIAPVAVAFKCSDPNGDPLSYEITQGPNGGALGSIDQGVGKVFYNPFPGFAGLDAFQYRGTARGLASAVQTASVSVSSPPAATPAAAVLARIKALVVAGWKVIRGGTTIQKLKVTKVPNGAAVEVRCKGKGCPFKRKRAKAAKGGTVNALPLFGDDTRLKPGQTVEVWITQQGAIGQVVRYTVRKGKTPKAQTLCLSPGAQAPGRC